MVSITSGILAIVFLFGAVMGLYWVIDPNAKLGMLSGLAVGFAGSLALFTNARRQDVFASTAAYAAVLVVFISGNLGARSDSSSIPTSASPAVTRIVYSTLVETSTRTFYQMTEASSSPSTTNSASTATNSAAMGSAKTGSLSYGNKLGIGLTVSIGGTMVIALLGCIFLSRRRRKS